eukprot:c9191_g1_i1.p1 GENE.c9191_g1_i1~~c9191_g1_i1.p1  ORF type:complete len:257 (-),score=25.29 c9191_g1_i1:39-809(-)
MLEEEEEPFIQGSRTGLGSTAAVRINTISELYEHHPCAFACGVFFRLVLFAIFLLPIFFGIGCYKAPCDKPLSLFLLIHGFNQVPPVMARLMLKTTESASSKALLGCIYVTSNIWSVVWFIQGSVWTFASTSCDPLLHDVSFYLVVITLGLLLLSCCVLPVVLCCLMCCLLTILEYAPPTQQGLTEAEIAALDTRKFKAGDLDDPACSICLSNYVSGEAVTPLVCQHHFHTECVKVWLRMSATCPICRAKQSHHEV